MRTCFILLTFCFAFFRVSGQESEKKQFDQIKIEIYKNDFQSRNGKKIDAKDISGTPYLDNNFQKAYILKINGTEIKDVLLRYNAYSDNMEFKKDGTNYAIAFPSEIYRIKLGDLSFIYTQYQSATKIKHGYFQLLHEGTYCLLKKYRSVVKFPERFDSKDSIRFVRLSPAYFIRHGEGNSYEITSQKQLIKLLQPIHQPVIDYIKANNINGKYESKLTSLMEYLEENVN